MVAEVSSIRVVTWIGLLVPVLFPQVTVCTAKIHTLPLVGILVQVTLVLLVVVGQLPQFDARMLYLIVEQSGATGLHTKVNSLKEKSALLI